MTTRYGIEIDPNVVGTYVLCYGDYWEGRSEIVLAGTYGEVCTAVSCFAKGNKRPVFISLYRPYRPSPNDPLHLQKVEVFR